jgi:hypothetical protein
MCGLKYKREKGHTAAARCYVVCWARGGGVAAAPNPNKAGAWTPSCSRKDFISKTGYYLSLTAIVGLLIGLPQHLQESINNRSAPLSLWFLLPSTCAVLTIYLTVAQTTNWGGWRPQWSATSDSYPISQLSHRSDNPLACFKVDGQINATLPTSSSETEVRTTNCASLY